MYIWAIMLVANKRMILDIHINFILEADDVVLLSGKYMFV